MKKEIVIIHPLFRGGGGENVCLNVIEALQNNFELTLVYSGKEINLEKLNHFFGTSIYDDKIKLLHVPSPNKGVILNVRLIERYLRKKLSRYNLLFSTSSDMDFGKRGIQYVHYPRFARDNNFSLVKKIYRFFCDLVSSYSKEKMKENLTLTNSKWTAEKIKEAYNIESTVIYPPVKDDFPEVPWEEKENTFICAGRIDPGKNIERNIEIIKKAREVYPEIKLYIAGIPGKKAYYNKIKKLVESNPDWVVLKGNLSKEELHSLMTRCRYGIHGMDEEHFGIVVAEMLKAGVIPFVPNGGGQVEIVKENENLVYNSKEDAVEKIINVLQDNSLQEIVREELKEHSKNFSEKKFKEEILNTVESFIKENENPNNI